MSSWVRSGASGLSPRVRGNPDAFALASRLGSIPARAGGTTARDAARIQVEGLSPRVRGNPLAYFPAVGNLAPV